MAIYCGNIILSSKVVDGDKSLDNAEKIARPCDEYSYVDVQLGEAHYIHYVVVYEGLPATNIKQSKSVVFLFCLFFVLQLVFMSQYRLLNLHADKSDIDKSTCGRKRTVCMI